MKNSNKNFKEIQNHLARFGYVFQGSEIYGGLANTWDYGPLGVLFNKNIRDLWWQEFITKESLNFGLDSKIIMNQEVWVASGHIHNFSDPLIENKENGKRYRADHLLKQYLPEINIEELSHEDLFKIINKNIKIHEGNQTNWSSIKEFNLMFETQQGVVEGKKAKVYLRPETAQGIFVNFKNIQRSMRLKLPFGVGQIGKSFRNEVTPGNFIFRTREFEQMELEFFFDPKSSKDFYKYYIDKSFNFAIKTGIRKESLFLRKHEEKELAHYSSATTDVEFEFPFGLGELMGITKRGDFDLKAHMNHSGESLEYFDDITHKKFIPHVIEPSMGLDRLALAILIDAYNIEKVNDDERVVLKLSKKLAPYQFAILPLSKKHHSESAKKVFLDLIKKGISVTYDETGSIGKRYRRQDAIGTPFAITVVDNTAIKGEVTIRNRDTMNQETINIKDIKNYI